MGTFTPFCHIYSMNINYYKGNTMKYKFKYNMFLQNDITSKNYFWLSNTRDDEQAIEYFIKCSKSNTFNCYGAVITCNDEQLFFIDSSELVREPLKYSLHN